MNDTTVLMIPLALMAMLVVAVAVLVPDSPRTCKQHIVDAGMEIVRFQQCKAEPRCMITTEDMVRLNKAIEFIKETECKP